MNRDYIYINHKYGLYARLAHVRYDGENSGVYVGRGTDIESALKIAYAEIASQHLPIEHPKISPSLLDEYAEFRDKWAEDKATQEKVAKAMSMDDDDMLDYMEAMAGYCGMYGSVV